MLKVVDTSSFTAKDDAELVRTIALEIKQGQFAYAIVTKCCTTPFEVVAYKCVEPHEGYMVCGPYQNGHHTDWSLEVLERIPSREELAELREKAANWDEFEENNRRIEAELEKDFEGLDFTKDSP
jgi:hypothetical protein